MRREARKAQRHTGRRSNFIGDALKLLSEASYIFPLHGFKTTIRQSTRCHEGTALTRFFLLYTLLTTSLFKLHAFPYEKNKNMNDDLVIAGKSFKSRFFVGTGKFSSNQSMLSAIEASGSQLVTVGLRRLDLDSEHGENITDALDPEKYLILPNTSGAANAEEAVTIARLAHAAGMPRITPYTNASPGDIASSPMACNIKNNKKRLIATAAAANGYNNTLSFQIGQRESLIGADTRSCGHWLRQQGMPNQWRKGF